MWPFDEALLSAQEESYAYTGDLLRMFESLVKLYQEHYYEFPRQGEDVLIPERAARHIQLALGELNKTRNRPKTPLDALRATESSVYGPREIEEIQEVLNSVGNGGGTAKPDSADEKTREPSTTPAPQGREEDGGVEQKPAPAPSSHPVAKREPPRVPPTSPVNGSTASTPSPSRRGDESEPTAPAQESGNARHDMPRKSPISNGKGDARSKSGTEAKRQNGDRSGGERVRGRPRVSGSPQQVAPPITPSALKELHNKLTALEHRLGRLERANASFPGGPGAAGSAPHARLEQVVHQTTQLRQEQGALRTGLASLREKIAQLEGALKDVASGKQESEMEPGPRTRRELEALKAGLEALESEQVEIKQRLADIEAWLDTMKSVLASLADQVSQLEGVIGASEPTPAPPAKLLGLLTRKKS